MDLPLVTVFASTRLQMPRTMARASSASRAGGDGRLVALQVVVQVIQDVVLEVLGGLAQGLELREFRHLQGAAAHQASPRLAQGLLQAGVVDGEDGAFRKLGGADFHVMAPIIPADAGRHEPPLARG